MTLQEIKQLDAFNRWANRIFFDVLTTQPLAGSTTTTYWQMIQHVGDHSSCRRGQIVTILRQLGVEPPSTGPIRFHRQSGEVE
jgi:uncharacterized damage-inducible protein DinB